MNSYPKNSGKIFAYIIVQRVKFLVAYPQTWNVCVFLALKSYRSQRLTLEGCPGIVTQRDSDSDSEWPNISHGHILSITIDASKPKAADYDSQESRRRKDLCLRCF